MGAQAPSSQGLGFAVGRPCLSRHYTLGLGLIKEMLLHFEKFLASFFFKREHQLRRALHTPIGVHIANFALIGKGRHRKWRPFTFTYVARGWQPLPLNGFPIHKHMGKL